MKSVICTACTQVHLVNSKTGKVLGADQSAGRREIIAAPGGMQPYPTRRNDVGKNNALNLTRHIQCTPVELARA
jgi:hypothetical protein